MCCCTAQDDDVFSCLRRCRFVKASKRGPRVEARSGALTAQARFCRRPGFRPHPKLAGPGTRACRRHEHRYPRLRSRLLAHGHFLGLIEQEGFSIEVRQRCVGFQYLALGGVSLRQRCRQQLFFSFTGESSAEDATLSIIGAGAARVPVGDEAVYSFTRVGAAQAAAGEDDMDSVAGSGAAQVPACAGDTCLIPGVGGSDAT